jgi:hypothetical protein
MSRVARGGLSRNAPRDNEQGPTDRPWCLIRQMAIRAIQGVVLVSLIACVPVADAQSQAAQPDLVLACQEASPPTFGLTLQNTASVPTAAIIGTILGNDKKYVTAEIDFTISRPRAADVNFRYFDPSVPAVGGRLDPWLVQLPPGASYTIRVTVPQGYRDLFETPGAIRVRLTTHELGRVSSFLQDLQFIHVWIGTLTSNSVAFPSDCVQRR